MAPRTHPSPALQAHEELPETAQTRADDCLSADGLEVLRHSARGATARLHALLHGVVVGVLFMGRHGRVDLVNQALCRMLDVPSAAELVGHSAAEVARLLSVRFADPAGFALHGFLGGSQQLILANGRILSRELLPVGLETEAHGVLVLLREVSQSASPLEVEPLHTATLVDELTELPNRRAFLAQASRRLRRASREARVASLFSLDLDGMKTINDRLGHTAGDQALQEVSALLRQVFRKGDLVARLGGDEFAVLSLDVTESEEAELLERLMRETALLNARPGRSWRLSLGIGAARFQASDPPVVEDLLARADAGVRAQKRARLTRTV